MTLMQSSMPILCKSTSRGSSCTPTAIWGDDSPHRGRCRDGAWQKPAIANKSWCLKTHRATISTKMDATYEITPEMLGLSWRRVLTALGIAVPTAFLYAVVFKLFLGHIGIGNIVASVLAVSFCVLLSRPFSRT